MRAKREPSAVEVAARIERSKLVIRGQLLVPGADRHVWVMPVPEKVWSSNERLHYRVRSTRVKAWREMSELQANALVSSAPVFPLEGKWDVELVLPFIRGGRRDLSNYVGTVVKAVVDGLVDAGVWPDDDGRHVRVVEPLWVKQNPQSTVEVRLGRIRG